MSILKSTNSGKYSEPITILHLVEDLHLFPVNFIKGDLGEIGQWTVDEYKSSHESIIQLYHGIWTFAHIMHAPEKVVIKRLYCKNDVDVIYDFWTCTDEVAKLEKLYNILKTFEDYV